MKWRTSREFEGLDRGKLVLPPPMNVRGSADIGDMVFDLNRPLLPLLSVVEPGIAGLALGLAAGL